MGRGAATTPWIPSFDTGRRFDPFMLVASSSTAGESGAGMPRVGCLDPFMTVTSQ